MSKTPGWHVLPNGIVAYSDPVATHYLDARDNFDVDWPSRMTLMKAPGESGQWIQLENVANYREEESPFRALTPRTSDPQRTITFLGPVKMRDLFEVDSEVPVSQYPLIGDDFAAWPDEDEEREGGEMAGLAAGSIPAPILEPLDLEVGDEDEAQVVIDEQVLTMETKVKELKEWCTKLGLATSGSKTKILNRLRAYKANEERKIALELAKKLYAEDERRPVAISVPKLPTRAEQDLHFLTHLPYAAWCAYCVAHRGKEDARKSEERSDKKDRGLSVISFDYGFTTTEGEDEERQFGTMLCVTESETKAILCVPVVGKGSVSLKQVTEEIVRFSMATSAGQSVIFQSDGERSTRQILRAVQHCRAQLGLHSEIRVTGRDQHASNGQAERAIQSVRRTAGSLRAFAEHKAQVKIQGSSHVFPWSFKHAAWLISRFRVIKGHTSFELMHDRTYVGKLALFGESVMYKDIRALKGEPVYRRGVWVGKSTWSDSHVILTPRGAIECRSIRRLPEQFRGDDLVVARGLPWHYSVQGILMRGKGAPKRDADPEEIDETLFEKRAMQAGQAVAMGLFTPTVVIGGATPGVAAPVTPGPEGMRSEVFGGMRGDADMGEIPQDSGARGSGEREESPSKRQRLEIPAAAVERAASPKRGPEAEGDGSPAKRLRRVSAEMPDGDEDEADEHVLEELEKILEDADVSGAVDEKPPEVDEAELARLDVEAEEAEVSRLMEMGVLLPVEEMEDGGYSITTKMVTTWKHRKEKGGWFRRARLVARQYKWSVFTDEAFAPTSAYVVCKLLLQHAIMDPKKMMSVYTVDVKDAFLMVPQPKEEKAYVMRGDKLYKLGRVLPGQRTAASRWYMCFRNKAEDFGLSVCVLQPSLMKKFDNSMCLTIHVDDLLLLGLDREIERFFRFLESGGWKLEAYGPFTPYEKFQYLKHKIMFNDQGVVIRPDEDHIVEAAALAGVTGRRFRTTPTNSEFNKLNKDDDLLDEGERTKYRSVVGKLMYISPDRPDIQYVTQGLASFMQSPTKRAWKFAQHLCSYLLGTKDEGIQMIANPMGTSVLNPSGNPSWDPDKEHLIEVICDADYAGNQMTRKSLSSVQIFVNGNLMESYVRAQKCISLSSGESEYVCMVGGVSEGIFVKALYEFITGVPCKLVCRTDSSAARGMAGRQGVGRVRHMAANLLWLQEKVRDRVVNITPVPTATNAADIGTKSLAKSRMLALKYLMKMVDGTDERIGQMEYRDVENRERIRRAGRQAANQMAGQMRIAMMMALTMVTDGHKVHSDYDSGLSEFHNEVDSLFTYGFYGMLVLAMIGALSLVYGMVLGLKCIRSRFGGQVTFCDEACEKEKCLNMRHQLEKVSLKLQMKEKELVRLREAATTRAFAVRDERFKEDFIHRFMELNLAVTRSGEAFHTCDCRFANAPRTHTKKVVRACRECMPDAVRGVLESSGPDEQHRGC